MKNIALKLESLHVNFISKGADTANAVPIPSDSGSFFATALPSKRSPSSHESTNFGMLKQISFLILHQLQYFREQVQV